jgi:hypothetical protein
MARNHADAQPKRALSEEQWQRLHELIQSTRDVSVVKLCETWGVSKARYYQRYPVNPKNENTRQTNPAGV